MTANLGQILTLVGLVLLVVNSLGRRRRRQTRELTSPVAAWWLKQGDFVAYGFILAGLFLWLKK